jgi:DNA-binding beta-propeller fold protein YncE
MSMKAFVLFGLLVVFLGSCARPRSAPDIRYPCEWPGSPGFTGNIDKQGILQPSGICFYPARKTFFVISDEGEIFEMRTDGTAVFSQKVPGDLEDVTVDPRTGLLYIVVEGEDVILEFDPDKPAVTRRFAVNRAFQGDPNFLQKQTDRYDNGIESLVFVPDDGHPEGGTFYAGNQEDPPCIMELFVPLRTGGGDAPEARILRVLPFKMDDPSGLAYDPLKKHLYAVSDADNIFVEITLEGKLVREYAFPGNDQEGFAWDDEGYLYIAQDSGGIIKLKDLSR